jgi:hypothetical protein
MRARIAAGISAARANRAAERTWRGAGRCSDPEAVAFIRAHAAYAAVKNGTLALLAARGGHLSRPDRAELLAAAERALSTGSRSAS